MSESIYTLQCMLGQANEALVKCRDQFQFYADEHEKQGKTEKAETNKRMVKMINNSLAFKAPKFKG